MRTIKELKEAFLNAFDGLSEQEKGTSVVEINLRGTEEPYSWRVAKLEVECGTKIGEKMLRKMEKLGII